MTEQSAEPQNVLGQGFGHRMARLIGTLGRCFILALVYTLVVFPLSAYFGGPATLVSKPLFVSSPFFGSDEAILAVQVITIFFVLAYFVLAGRYGLPLYVKAFGTSPSLLRLILVIPTPLLFLVITTIIFGGLIEIQGGEFSKALLIYTKVTVWPFAVAVPIAGLISALSLPLPSYMQEPTELLEVFGELREKVKKLPTLLSRIAGVIDPALQGNVVGTMLALLSVTALATAGISGDPLVFVLFFALPLINALGDYPAFVVFRRLRRRMFTTAPPARMAR